jgi:tetrahydromethanopterin S-methyltransferase subunit B
MDEKELFLKKFEQKLRDRLDDKALSSLHGDTVGNLNGDYGSSDYETFRIEKSPKSNSWYERACSISEKLFKLEPDKATGEKFQKSLFGAHLNCTPSGVMSFSVIVSLILIIFGLLLFILGQDTIGFGIVFVGVGAYFALQNIPSLFERRFRAKANDEVIIGIFYIVAFMRFNSNLELAIGFAANYLSGPLGLDFKRILWEIENAEYPDIKQALDHYLEGWRDENLEFLESIYLIESSLFEGEDIRRIILLDKSLDTILQGSYERMIHFAQELTGKVSTFNMIGVVLPILGLIILPLAASFGDPKGVWEVVFLLYNILFPIGVAYFGFMIIFNRPGGVNSVKKPNIKNIEQLQKYPLNLGGNTIYLSPVVPALFVGVLFFSIGFSPIILHTFGLDETLNTVLGNMFEDGSFSVFQSYETIDKNGGYIYGPYGVYPGLLSLFIPLGIAFSFGIYLRTKYGKLIGLRDKTKKLEKEFASATFQLGNRINEGIASELAFGAVADTMRGTETGKFFSEIDSNIKFNGLSVEGAIFDSDKGAINEYQSELIISSMKIFIKANEKGPEISAKTLVDLSRYLSEIHMSAERLKDLLSESLGSMKGQANYLAPLISGVVVSIVSLVTMIMGSLATATSELGTSGAGADSLSGFLGQSIPTFMFQAVVGVYITALVAILVFMVTNLEGGNDPIFTKFTIGDTMIKSIRRYAIIVACGILLFAYVGSQVIGSIV